MNWLLNMVICRNNDGFVLNNYIALFTAVNSLLLLLNNIAKRGQVKLVFDGLAFCVQVGLPELAYSD